MTEWLEREYFNQPAMPPLGQAMFANQAGQVCDTNLRLCPSGMTWVLACSGDPTPSP